MDEGGASIGNFSGESSVGSNHTEYETAEAPSEIPGRVWLYYIVYILFG